MATEASRLQSERYFPCGCLDAIFAYACEGSRRRALDLGLVCRFWQDRFQLDDRMWEVIALQLRQSIVIGPAAPSFHSLHPSWSTYNALRLAFTQAKNLQPLSSGTLHPIEDCNMEFSCPMYSEALRYVAPGVSFCDGCKLNVYTVRNQEEMQAAASKGRCVQFSLRDALPSLEHRSVHHVAVLAPSEVQGRRLLQGLAAACDTLASSNTSNPVHAPKRSNVVFPELQLDFNSSSHQQGSIVFHYLTSEEAAAYREPDGFPEGDFSEDSDSSISDDCDYTPKSKGAPTGTEPKADPSTGSSLLQKKEVFTGRFAAAIQIANRGDPKVSHAWANRLRSSECLFTSARLPPSSSVPDRVSELFATLWQRFFPPRRTIRGRKMAPRRPPVNG